MDFSGQFEVDEDVEFHARAALNDTCGEGNFRDSEARSRRENRRLDGIHSSKGLMRKAFAPIKYLIPGMFAEGHSLLAGAPKIGKSWLIMDVALAVATGGKAFKNVEATAFGDVLYLALEDNERRLQSRMSRLQPFGWEGHDNLSFATEWPRADEGGIDKIKAWAASVLKPTLVIVDVLTAFRPRTQPRANVYESDYAAVRALTELSIDLSLAVITVHHTRKDREGADPFDRVSGSTGLSGAADATFILDRDGAGVTLYGRGRDVPEIETALSFDPDACKWKIEGRSAEVHMSDGGRAIVEALKVSPGGEPLTTAELVVATGLPNQSVKQYTYQMHLKGEIKKVSKGRFALQDHLG